jgi:hypothetical protein
MAAAGSDVPGAALAAESPRARADTPTVVTSHVTSPLPSPRGRDSPPLETHHEASCERLSADHEEKAAEEAQPASPALTEEQQSAKAAGANVVGPCSVWTPRGSGKGSGKAKAEAEGEAAAREAAAQIVTEMLDKVIADAPGAEAEAPAAAAPKKRRWWRRA